MSGGKWWLDTPEVSPLDVALQAEGVSGKLAELARSIYAQESSSGKNTATSNAGARGGMQILPGTFREVAEKGWNIDDPVDNARAGVRYLLKMAERAGGDPALAAAGYYGGPGGMDKAKRGEAVSDPRNPKAPNTLEYAEQVVGRMAGDTKAQPSARKGQDGAEWWKDYPEAQPDTKEPLRADAAADKPKPSMGRELLRQVGLTARAGINGVASIPAMLSDAVTGPINAGLDLVRGEGNGFRFKKAGASMNDLMTRAGVPEPQNSTERVVGDVAAAMAGAGGFVGAGKAIAQAGGVTASGSDRRVQVTRGASKVKVDLGYKVEAGDVIVIGERLF